MENHQAYCGGYKFSKVLIITWNTQFYHWQQMLSVAWSDGLTLFIFGKMSVSYPGLNSHIVCLLATLSIKNGIPWGKKAKHFWNNHHTSEYRSTLYFLIISSIQLLSHVQPHGLQHAWLPCPSPTPRACSDLCPSSWWCHPAISSSVVPFSSCPQSYPASGSFPVSQFFISGGQSIGASASASSSEYSGLISFRMD